MVITEPGRSPRLERVRQRLERWRRTRPHPRAPIPEPIWAAAVALVAQYGVYGTARGVHLDYGALKAHVDAAARPRVPSGFVELPAPPPSVGDACVVEIDGPRATVRLRLTGVSLADLADLSRTLAGVDA